MDNAVDNSFDVAVVGGGAAGLAGALTLVRARRSVLVIDSGSPRNAPAAHMHGYLGQDGESPAALLARGRAVPGLGARWGRDVLHCPYCHGWEVRDRPIAVLADGPLAVHQAQLWRHWSAHTTLLAHTWRLTAEDRELLAALGVDVVEGEVTGLAVHDDLLTGVTLEGGAEVGCRALVVAPRFTARSGVLTSLGLPTVVMERDGRAIGTCVESDPATGATALRGVWVAGNVTAPMEKVAGAAAQGAQAAMAINADLIEAETRRAVEAHRAGADV